LPWVPVINTNSMQAQPLGTPPAANQPDVSQTGLAPPSATEHYSNQAKTTAIASGVLGTAGIAGLLVSKLPNWARWGAGGAIVASLGLAYKAYTSMATVGKTGTEKIKNWIKVSFFNPQQATAPTNEVSQMGLLDYNSRLATKKYQILSGMGKTMFDNVKLPNL